MMEDTVQKLNELAQDEEYVKYVLSLGTAEKMSEELLNKGVNLSCEDIHKIGAILRKKQEGELNDEELCEVYGGFFWALVGAISLSAACLSAIVLAACGPKC